MQINKVVPAVGVGAAVLILGGLIAGMAHDASTPISDYGPPAMITAAATTTPIEPPAATGQNFTVPTAEAQPVTTEQSFPGEGEWMVGTDVAPGQYHTDGPTPSAYPLCTIIRERSTTGDVKTDVISAKNSKGPLTITIDSTDAAVKSYGCQQWTKLGG